MRSSNRTLKPTIILEVEGTILCTQMAKFIHWHVSAERRDPQSARVPEKWVRSSIIRETCKNKWNSVVFTWTLETYLSSYLTSWWTTVGQNHVHWKDQILYSTGNNWHRPLEKENDTWHHFTKLAFSLLRWAWINFVDVLTATSASVTGSISIQQVLQLLKSTGIEVVKRKERKNARGRVSCCV